MTPLKGGHIPGTADPHRPFRGIDGGWWIRCPKGGLRPIGHGDVTHCGCGYRIVPLGGLVQDFREPDEEPVKGAEYR